MSEKYYQLGTHTNEQWLEIHDELCEVTNGLDNIPDRACTCTNDLLHSPTRGIFLLSDDEANTLKNDPRIKFLNVDYASYPETYKPDPDDLTATTVEQLNRWNGKSVKVYREFETSATLPDPVTSADYDRTGYQILRLMYKRDQWIENGNADNVVKTEQLTQFGDGRDVDVIVADDGAGWMGHPEFQNNCINGDAPYGYTGGNVLPGNGTCDTLDLILDAPYYLDPDYFDADASNRLTTRWDGTTVPVESFARGWWTSTANRSATFNAAHPSAGTTGAITSSYTRAYCNGTNTSLPNGGAGTVARHCTPCMALTYGRTQGWAYNANKWALNLYGTNGSDIEQGFDAQKIFHNTKPVNPKYGTQDPTVSSNSWGYRASDKGSAGHYYHFRTNNPVTYGGTGSEPQFISHMGSQGDAGRWKSEMKTNSYTTALDELCEAGVLFVCAAGNSNQKQVNWDHPDFNNYISDNQFRDLEDTTYYEFGIAVTGTTNRRGFPQQGGKEGINAASYSLTSTEPNPSIVSVTGTDRSGSISFSNGTIQVRVGDTISLQHNGTTPLFFKTTNTSGPSDQVSGATGQGANNGNTITWTPSSAGTYYYKTNGSSAQGGQIRVTAQETIYKTINIGALDDDFYTSKECKVGYSDRGNGIDFYAPADGTLAANSKYTPEGDYPDTYPGFTANSGSGAGVPEECAFSGTSAACPVAAGFVACLVGLNRNWTHEDVKDYVNSLDNQTTDDFYYGTESTSATTTNWTDYRCLEGGDAKVIYQDLDKITQTTFPKRSSTLNAGLTLKGLAVNIKQRFDRG